LTMCRRMTLGFSDGSKWQATASRIIAFSSSRESARVKIEKPRARASYPPSGDSCTEKMISLGAMGIASSDYTRVQEIGSNVTFGAGGSSAHREVGDGTD